MRDESVLSGGLCGHGGDHKQGVWHVYECFSRSEGRRNVYHHTIDPWVGSGGVEDAKSQGEELYVGVLQREACRTLEARYIVGSSMWSLDSIIWAVLDHFET